MGSTMRGTPNVVAGAAAAAAVTLPAAVVGAVFGTDAVAGAIATSAAIAVAPATPSANRTVRNAHLRLEWGDSVSSRLFRLLLVVVVEAAARLAAQQLGGNHAPQQRDGCVVGVAELVIQRVEDGQAGVEADQVEQGERPHREPAAALHGGV